MARRVLIVEDDEKSRRLLRDVLAFHGYAVSESESGEHALALAREARPDAALLDIQLPGLNGFELLEALRGLPGPPLTVVAVTASVMEHDRKRILAAGFDAYVAKPVNIRQLVELLKERLDNVTP